MEHVYVVCVVWGIGLSLYVGMCMCMSMCV